MKTGDRALLVGSVSSTPAAPEEVVVQIEDATGAIDLITVKKAALYDPGEWIGLFGWFLAGFLAVFIFLAVDSRIKYRHYLEHACAPPNGCTITPPDTDQ